MKKRINQVLKNKIKAQRDPGITEEDLNVKYVLIKKLGKQLRLKKLQQNWRKRIRLRRLKN